MMRSNSVMVVKNLDHRISYPHIHLAINEFVRNGVWMSVKLPPILTFSGSGVYWMRVKTTEGLPAEYRLLSKPLYMVEYL